MNIFEISADLDNVINQLLENGGELTDELAEQLAITEENLHAKLKSYHFVLGQMKGNELIIKEEIARLTDRKKANDKAMERLENIITDVVNKFGNEKKAIKGVVPEGKVIDLGTVKFSTSKSSACNIIDGENLEAKYNDCNIKLPYENLLEIVNTLQNTDRIYLTQYLVANKIEPNKTRIKEDLLAGLEVPGAELSKDFNLSRK